ncbi:MAG: biotin carboxylase N-terminal domain-containing protein, partial [Dehalococcoidia bacterium]
MPIRSVFVANRGEISIRISRAAADLGIRSVAVFSSDDSESLHTRVADDAVPLEGRGVSAYLDIPSIVRAAKTAGCDAIHPGYGFLAENPDLARACAETDLTFVGPGIDNLELFGDKARAREIAAAAGVPVLRGSKGPVTLEEAAEFLDSLGHGGAVMVKAVAGGGGRGTRVVPNADELEPTYERCRSEAQRAFGNGALYVEE